MLTHLNALVIDISSDESGGEEAATQAPISEFEIPSTCILLMRAPQLTSQQILMMTLPQTGQFRE